MSTVRSGITSDAWVVLCIRGARAHSPRPLALHFVCQKHNHTLPRMVRHIRAIMVVNRLGQASGLRRDWRLPVGSGDASHLCAVTFAAAVSTAWKYITKRVLKRYHQPGAVLVPKLGVSVHQLHAFMTTQHTSEMLRTQKKLQHCYKGILLLLLLVLCPVCCCWV